MKKVLVIGIKGMAGHVMFESFRQKEGYSIYGIARNIADEENIFNIDVADEAAVENIIKNQNFDAVVNCIGILNKDAEDNPSKAIWFNSYFPHFLEKITKSTKTKVIHISTDCVFNGKRGGYTENDFKDGCGFYAQSKALGEIDNDKDLTIRTSIIGPELNKNGIGLFHWFMSQPKDASLKGYSQAFWSGITTIELAKVVDFMLQNDVSGMVQVAPKEKIDKFSLLNLFNEIFRENSLEISSDSAYEVDKSLVSIREDVRYPTPDYRTMLLEMKDWIAKHPDLYNY